MRKYKVELKVFGNVAIQNPINFNTDKELSYGDIFKSDINISRATNGFKISTTVRTRNKERAHKVALIFVSKMLDVLSLRIQEGLVIDNYFSPINQSGKEVKVIVSREEFDSCFENARELNLYKNKLLRAMSWYRKGLYTVDPFDKFIAFWNSITVVGDGYCRDNDRTRRGIINKVWDCFEQIWGLESSWDIINRDGQWINRTNETRNKIAHGGIPVDIDYIDDVLEQLELLEVASYKFLSDWIRRFEPHILG